MTTYAFDDAGRLSGWFYPDATRVTFAYDGVGNRTLAHDPIGRYTTTYDVLDRKSTYTTPLNKLMTYCYDPKSSRTLMIEPEGGRLTIAYDALAHTSSIVNPQGDRTTYSYDANSRRTGMVLGNQTRCSWTYDSADRPTRVLNLKSDGTTISMFDYSLDNVGNRTGILYADGKRATYTYDDIYQLKREQNGPIDYDATFTYDPVGNRTVIDDGLLTTSTYDNANQLVATFDSKTNTTFTFDRNGNQIEAFDSGTQIVTQVWDYEDRMIGAVVAGLDLTFSASYDPDHRRVSGSQTVGKETSAANLLWDDENLLKKYLLDGSPQVLYTMEPILYGNLISQRQGTDTSYYHFDALGSTYHMTDVTQGVVNEYLYTAFGITIPQGEKHPNIFTFVGQLGYQLDNPFWYSIRRRYYAPALARWFSRDPLSVTPCYCYVTNLPPSFVDPTGLLCESRQRIVFQDPQPNGPWQCVATIYGSVNVFSNSCCESDEGAALISITMDAYCAEPTNLGLGRTGVGCNAVTEQFLRNYRSIRATLTGGSNCRVRGVRTEENSGLGGCRTASIDLLCRIPCSDPPPRCEGQCNGFSGGFQVLHEGESRIASQLFGGSFSVSVTSNKNPPCCTWDECRSSLTLSQGQV